MLIASFIFLLCQFSSWSRMVHQKDRTAKAAKCGVVYDIQCPECDQHYIGETARTLGTRIKEHLSCRQPLSAISEHKLSTGHQCSMKDVHILDHGKNWHRRKIKEAINIHRKKPVSLYCVVLICVLCCSHCIFTLKMVRVYDKKDPRMARISMYVNHQLMDTVYFPHWVR